MSNQLLALGGCGLLHCLTFPAPGLTIGIALPVEAQPMTSPHLQSNLPALGTPSYSDPITDLNESNQSSVPLIQKSGASTLKQKLLLKKIADNLALPRDTQEVVSVLKAVF